MLRDAAFAIRIIFQHGDAFLQRLHQFFADNGLQQIVHGAVRQSILGILEILESADEDHLRLNPQRLQLF